MKWHVSVAVIAVLCLGLFCSLESTTSVAQAQGSAIEQQKITVLSPRGKPPAIQLKPMAPRPSTLDGKTVFLVNDGYLGTDLLLGEMLAWFKANRPKVNVFYKPMTGGGFTAEDPALWAEIKEKADAVVMGMGH
ncbi:MAG: Thiol-disulfide oxidoreductase protein [Acidobacteria bacterium]|nr:Thiol-disulfide oxidoreductase protein [Acidobacteriota bacterium]